MTNIYQGDPRLFLGQGTLIRTERARELNSGNALWPDIVALYHFNGNNNDSKNSNHGTRNGSGPPFDDVNQKLGPAAALFNGTDDYVDMGNQASLNFDYNDPVSFSQWILKSSNNTHDMLLSKAELTGNGRGYLLYQNGTTGKLTFVLTSMAGNRLFVEETTASITDTTTLHHVGLTYDGSTDASGVHIVVDSIDVPLTTVEDTLSGTTLNSKPFQIGMWDSTGFPFHGLIDEVAVFDRELSLNEVEALHNEQIDKEHIAKIIGSDLKFTGGQPVMDRGLENLALISLFTRPGWCGNTLFKDENQKLGSKFEEISNQSITLQMINDLRNAGERALDNPAFGNVDVEISNPNSYRLEAKNTLQPPGQDVKTLLIAKNGLNWIAQARDPAYLRG